MRVTLGDKLGAQLGQLRKQLAPTIKPISATHAIPEPPKSQVGWVTPILDESQIVGDLLEWLFQRGHLRKEVTKEQLIVLQGTYFKETVHD